MGEAAGTHGVYRPGGSALNAGQAGSTCAARHIAHQSKPKPAAEAVLADCREAIHGALALARDTLGKPSTAAKQMAEAMAKMSCFGAAVRNTAEIRRLLRQVTETLARFTEETAIADASELPLLFRYRDMLITQQMVLFAMQDYAAHGLHSRGAGLYTDATGEKPRPAFRRIAVFCWK